MIVAADALADPLSTRRPNRRRFSRSPPYSSLRRLTFFVQNWSIRWQVAGHHLAAVKKRPACNRPAASTKARTSSSIISPV